MTFNYKICIHLQPTLIRVHIYLYLCIYIHEVEKMKSNTLREHVLCYREI